MEEESNCRICSEILYEKVSIHEIYKRKYDIIELIEELTSLEIKVNEHYPQSICLQCAEKLVEFHIFRRMILESEDRFQLAEELYSSQQMQNVYSKNLNKQTTFLSRTTDYRIDLVTENCREGEPILVRARLEPVETARHPQVNDESTINNILNFGQQNDVEMDAFSTVVTENQSCMNLESIDPTLTFDFNDEQNLAANEQAIDRNAASTSFVESFTEMCRSILDAAGGGKAEQNHPVIELEEGNGALINPSKGSMKTIADELNVANIRQPFVVLKDIMKRQRSKEFRPIAGRAREIHGREATSAVSDKFQCETCSRIFNNKYNFLNHFRYTHMKQFVRMKCPHCPRSFKCPTKERDPVNLRRHIRNVHKQESPNSTADCASIQCSSCAETFQGPVDMYIHSKIHDPEDVETADGQNLNCDTCQIDLSSAGDYIAHSMIVHGMKDEKEIKLFRCRWCGVRCKTILGVYSHVRGAHKYDGKLPVVSSDEVSNIPAEPRIYPCDVCGNILRTKTSYNQHIAIHANDKPFNCNVCSAKFITNASLKRHYAIHSGEKKFKCDQCGKSFRQTAHLKTHRKQHGIGFIEAFTCNICNKEFMQKGSLKTHMWSHMRDGEKPFKCSYCNKGFLWKNQMDNHFRMKKCV